jgi:hypothetical protein
MGEPAQILRSLGEGAGTRAAVLTTYNASFPFFEHVVLPRLRSVGCRHVLLLVDAARFAEAANTPDQRPGLAGTHYSLVPVAAPGAFHPKLVLRLGERNGRMWLGSHNLTHAGLNHNREVTTAADLRGDEAARRLVRQGWRAVRSWLPPAPIAEEAAEAVERLAPWVAEDDGVPMALPMVLSSTPTDPLWPRLRALLPRVERVTVVGPFFDNRLAFLQVLHDELGPAEIRVALQPDAACFPADRRHALPPAVRIVHAASLLDGGAPYLHAKALLFEGRDGAVLVTGSANPSAPAFLGGAQGNCEAVVVQQVDAAADPLGLHGLRDAAPLTDEDWAQLPPSIPYELGPPSTPVRLGTADRREIVLDAPVDGVGEIRFIGDADQPLGPLRHDETPLECVATPDAIAPEAVRWLELWRGADLAARVLVHHRRALRRLCRTGAEERLTDVLQSLETEHPDLASLLALLDPMLDQPVHIRTVTLPTTSPATARRVEAFGAGGVDVAPPEVTREDAYATEGSLAEVMLYVHHRLGATVGLVERSEEELVGSDDEALLAQVRPLDVDSRERIQGRFDRLTKRLGKRLVPAAGTPSERIPRLAAVLGLAHATVCRTPPAPHQPHDHLRLARADALTRLLVDGVAAAFFQRDLVKASSLLGEHAEEVRLVPVLLAWLCCELRLGPPDPDCRRVDDRELTRRAVWLALLPELDEDQWDRLHDKVSSADSSTGGSEWFARARRSAAHLCAVRASPRAHVSPLDRARPGDLLWLGGDILRVVQKEVGGPRGERVVQWLEPGRAYGRAFPNAVPLRAEAWRG